MNRSSKYTKEFLEPLVKKNFTITGICRDLGISTSGGASSYIRNKIDSLGINRAHFTGRRILGKKNGNFGKTPLSLVMVKHSTYSLYWLRQRIIEEKIIPYICECGNHGIWIGKSLTLQLDHINGIRDDNRISNLRFLCPNCHSQTATFGAKNKKHGDFDVAVA